MRQDKPGTSCLARVALLALATLMLSSCAQLKLPSWTKDVAFWKKEQPKPKKKVAVRAVVPAPEDTIREIQHSLNKLGFRAGKADGLAGRRTRTAIRRYERKHGLVVKGRPTRPVLAHIRRTLKERNKPKEPKIEAPVVAAAKPVEKTVTARSAPPLPIYESGTVYIYQDGRVERVTAVSSGKVRWRRNDGTSFTADRNFLLPWTYWETGTRRGKVLLWKSRDGELWPGSAGQKMSYEATVTVMNRAGQGRPKNSTEQWTCTNRGHERLRVIAGTFDTIRFVCVHLIGDKKRAATRVWHYAPRIRHYVRFEERNPGDATSRLSELVAVRPTAAGWPPVVRAALEQHLVAALAEQPNGRKVRWSSSGIPTKVTVQMTSGFVDDKRRQCRRFIQTWSRNGAQRAYPGAACRSSSGRWVIPVAKLEKNRLIAIASDRR